MERVIIDPQTLAVLVRIAKALERIAVTLEGLPSLQLIPIKNLEDLKRSVAPHPSEED